MSKTIPFLCLVLTASAGLAADCPSCGASKDKAASAVDSRAPNDGTGRHATRNPSVIQVSLTQAADGDASKTAPAPAPRAAGPAGAGTKVDMIKLRHDLEKMRQERESLAIIRNSIAEQDREAARSAHKPNAIANKRKQALADLNQEKADSPDVPGQPLPRQYAITPAPGNNKAVDPLGQAQSLFRGGDNEGALKAYRSVDLNSSNLAPDERLLIQYMIATCLRRLGKLDEAHAGYEEVVNAGGDPFLVQNARWQLDSIRWRKDFDNDLKLIQQRIKDLQSSQPSENRR